MALKERVNYLSQTYKPNFLLALVVQILFIGCSDPIEPEFEFREGLIYIDALASTEEGTSYAIISQTKNLFGINQAVEVTGAKVYFLNQNTNTRIELSELEGAYFPPPDFKVLEKELWSLEVILDDGRIYLSEPEKVPVPIPNTSYKVLYKKQLLYSEAYKGFVPGHEIAATFNDPSGENNFYYWRFKSFEKLINCRICNDYQVLRDGNCMVVNQGADDSPLKYYYTYECEEDCWRIRYSQNIKLFSDEFVNGQKVIQLPVGDILLYTNDNILVQMQQFSISQKAYGYFKTLKDLVDNNGGFNAPLPAALVGNLFNEENSEEFVLGRFTVASSRVTPILIERIFIEESQLEQRIITNPEGNEVPPLMVTMAPCISGRYRTSNLPVGWPE